MCMRGNRRGVELRVLLEFLKASSSKEHFDLEHKGGLPDLQHLRSS